MAGLQIRLDGGDTLGPRLKARAKKFSEKQTVALQSTTKKAAELIETAGRANIAQGGNFSSARWQEGFRATVQFLGRSDLVIRVTHAVSYWRVRVRRKDPRQADALDTAVLRQRERQESEGLW
jgi:hypothetical protein